MIVLTVISIVIVLITDLIIDLHERFVVIKKQRSIWTSKWMYVLVIILNLLAIAVVVMMLIKEISQ